MLGLNLNHVSKRGHWCIKRHSRQRYIVVNWYNHCDHCRRYVRFMKRLYFHVKQISYDVQFPYPDRRSPWHRKLLPHFRLVWAVIVILNNKIMWQCCIIKGTKYAIQIASVSYEPLCINMIICIPDNATDTYAFNECNLHFNLYLVHAWCVNTAVELNCISYMICLVLFRSKTQYIRTQDIIFVLHRVMNVINWRYLSLWCDKVAISVIALPVWLLNITGMSYIIGCWQFRYNKFVYLWLPWQLYHVFGSVTGHVCIRRGWNILLYKATLRSTSISHLVRICSRSFRNIKHHHMHYELARKCIRDIMSWG